MLQSSRNSISATGTYNREGAESKRATSDIIHKVVIIGFSRTGNHPSRKIRQEETNLDAADGHKDNIKINLKYTEWNRITPTDFLKISEGRKLTTGFTSFISCGLQGGKDMQSDFGGQTASKTDAWRTGKMK